MNTTPKIIRTKLKKNILLREYIEISKEIINYKKSNQLLNTVYRNESYFQIFIILLDSFIESKNIHESNISKALKCSKLTTQKYLSDFNENGIIFFKIDKKDKRRKNIFFTELMINEISKMLKIFRNRIDFKGF